MLLRAQGQVVVNSLEYLGYSLAPLAIMMVPLALVMIQVESHFAWRGLDPGESAIVTATVAGHRAGQRACGATVSAARSRG